jgi:hypothetical protein
MWARVIFFSFFYKSITSYFLLSIKNADIFPDEASLMPTLYLIFNHQFTEAQKAEARTSLAVQRIISLPAELQETWSNIPPDLPALEDYLSPIRAWVSSQASKGDYILIQGDFGACWLMVQFALRRGLVAVYSTTEREAEEEIQTDGTVKLIHHFKHRMFRRYGA